MTDFERRDLLKALAIAPMAASLGVATGQLERAGRAMARAAELPNEAAAPAFFSAPEWRTLRVLVDDIIPRDARSGSATDAKVPEFIDFLMADRDATPASRTAMHGGLAWIEHESRSRFTKSYADATAAERKQILDDIAWPARAKPEHSHGVAFFSRLRDLTASGFFSSAMGWKDVQYRGNVARPAWDGCPPEALQKLGVSYS